MKIGILGGTGNMGGGLALRLSLKHDVTVGSRSVDKAGEAAGELEAKARGFYQAAMRGSITGALNEDAVAGRDIVIETLPASAAVTTLATIKDKFTPGQVVVSCVVPMKRHGKLYTWSPVVAGGRDQARSAAELIQEAVPTARVVSAFQTVPAQYLNDINGILDLDVLVAGDDAAAVETVMGLVRDIPGLRPLRVGPLENSKWVESLTPLLLNAAILNGLHDPSIRIVPWVPDDVDLNASTA
ncbi:MAG: NADPH-dependent F420 reductase [Candidatus Bathyarchaeota archaeon]|nr:NADPH-dependent F420 reductase [Candidatus Bathyarchaeota archaeon]